MVIVSKFGGTSAKDGKTLEHVVENIVLASPERRVIVVSAPGKRFSDDRKITDLLIEIGEIYHGSHLYPMGLVDEFKGRFSDIIHYLGIESSFLEFPFKLLEAKIKTRIDNKEEYLDSIKPLGEIINAQILAKLLRRKGANSTVYLPEKIGMATDGNFGNAKLREDSYAKISKTLMPVLGDTNEVIVVPGFYGVDEKGRYATFPRGGSDLTGAILANSINASLYENWTDADGIRRTDPRIVEDAQTIHKMTYREARELAFSGADILHPDTLTPLIAKNISLNVRNTFNLGNQGTYITTGKPKNGHIVEGISYKEGFTLINIEKIGMDDEIGYLNRLTNFFAQQGISISQMTTSIDSVAIAISANGTGEKIQNVKNLIVQDRLADADGVSISYNKALVCVVGEGMRHTPGVLERLSHALASNGINIETIYQGPSERSIILGLDSKDAKNAVKAIHDIYFRDKGTAK